MAYRLELTPSAVKDLAKLDRPVAIRIQRFLRERVAPADNPRQLGTQLIGRPFWRYRVGYYRVLAEIQDGASLILAVEIGHRRTVYR